jgi:hypothetical protein
MHAFTLYGLDENLRAVSVEILKADAVDSRLKSLAEQRLQRFVSVELWRGSERLLRMSRRGAVNFHA